MPQNRGRIVMWELTRACRLSCVACTVSAQPRRSPVELSTYEAYKTIDQVVALQPADFIMTGGDPLERSDIYQLIDYARRRGLQPSMNVSATSLLTGAAVGKLKRNGLSRLDVSLDSCVPDRHDAQRGINGQFAATLMAIRWARTSDLPVGVNTLLSRRNANDLESLAGLLTDVGAVCWNLYFLVPIGDTKTTDILAGKELEDVMRRLETIRSRVAYPVRIFEAPQYRTFDRTEVLFISHTGEVSASPFLPLTAGNVRYQPLASLYRTSELLASLRDGSNLKGKCARCEYRRTCGGSRARAFAITGDLYAADPLCSYQPGPLADSIPVVEVRGTA